MNPRQAVQASRKAKSKHISQINLFQQSTASIKKAAQILLSKKVISLQDSSSDMDFRINRKTAKIIDMVSNNDLSSQKFTQSQSINQLILNNLNLAHEKYGVYESSSEASSDEEQKLICQKEEIETIIESVNKQPQNGKLTFICKLLGTQRLDYYFKIQKVKGIIKEMPAIHQIKRLGNFSLYEIQYNSQLKKFIISLTLNHQTIKQTIPLVFSANAVYLDLDLSYDFKSQKSLKINILEGLIASCILQGQKLADQIIELNGKRNFKAKLFQKMLTIDDQTISLIRQNKNIGPLIRLLKFLIEEQDWQYGIGSKLMSNSSYVTIVQTFITQMLKVKFSVGKDERQDFKIQQSIKLIELFLHFQCIIAADSKRLRNLDQRQTNQKIKEFIQFSFQTNQIHIYHKFIQFIIKHQKDILPQGYDTIRDYTFNYPLDSHQIILTTLENIIYTTKIKKKHNNTLEMFIEAFSNKRFEPSNIYGKSIEFMKLYTNQIFEMIQLSSVSFSDFMGFYKVYWSFKQNDYLEVLICNQKLRAKMGQYIKRIKQRFTKEGEKEQTACFELIQLIFITKKDDQIINSEEIFDKLVGYLFEYSKKQALIEKNIKLYFEIFKRGPNIFSYNFIQNVSHNVSRLLDKMGVQKGLSLLGKYFHEDYLKDQKLIQTFNRILQSLIFKLIPEKKNFFEELKTSNNHAKWHAEFKYPIYFNQSILERIMRSMQKLLPNDLQQRKALTKKILNEIDRYVTDLDASANLKAIVQIDSLELQVENVMQYLTSKRGYLKILLKILNKGSGHQKQMLQESLNEIFRLLEQRNIQFIKVKQIATMKQNQKLTFNKLTSQYKIPDQVQLLYTTGTQLLNQLQTLKSFIRDIGQTFQSPNYQQFINKLNSFKKIYETESMKQANFNAQIPIFKDFKNQILRCYKLKPFYAGENLKQQQISIIIKRSHVLLQKLYAYINNLYEKYENKQCMSQLINYFNPKKQDSIEFKNILCLNQKQKIPQGIDEIFTIYCIVADNQVYHNFLLALITQISRFSIKEPIFERYFDLTSSIKHKKNINLYGIQKQFSELNNKLNHYKISFQDDVQILKAFSLIHQNKPLIDYYRSIKLELKDIKDKVNEDGGEVTYDEIQDIETTLEFFQNVYTIEGFKFNDYLKEVRRFIEEKKFVSKRFELSGPLKTAFCLRKKIQEQIFNLKDSSRNATRMIQSFNRFVQFEIRNNKQNVQKLITEVKIHNQDNKLTIEDENEIYSTKEKAIMISRTLGAKEEDKKKKKNIQRFLEILKLYEQLKQKQMKLIQLGYRQFQNHHIVEIIVDCDINKIKKTIEVRHRLLQEWKKNIKILYQINYKSAHLSGANFKAFYDFILQGKDVQEMPSWLAIINDNVALHNQIVAKIDKATEISKEFDALRLITSYFKKLKQKTQCVIAEDRDLQFVHFKIMSKQNGDFFRGIEQIGQNRINELKFEHMLIATKETSQQQIMSFIERALRDIDSQYVILGFSNLNRRKQQMIVNEVKMYKQQMGSENFKLKLCLVGDSQIQLLYKFAAEQMSKNQHKNINIQQCKMAYQNKIKKELARSMIVYSSKSGFGKTTFIKNHSKKQYNCDEHFYLPLSGVMAVPVETLDQNHQTIIVNQTEKFLWDRFEQLAQYFQQVKRKGRRSCLVIQIFNIEPSVTEIINKFLENVLFFKHHKYKNKTNKIPQDIPIYVQLENISLPVHSKLARNTGIPPQLQQLSFLRQIRQQCGQKIVKNIQQFSCKDIILNKNSQRQAKQLNYILSYLQKLDDNTVNTIDIPHFQSYKLINILEQSARKLIQKYFFDHFQKKNPIQTPSGYLWTYFTSLLLEAAKKFSKSFFLQVKEIAGLDANVSAYNKTLHSQMKLKESFRSQFFKVILQNCLDFIERTVKPGEQGNSSSLQQTLKDLPFLIIPNAQNEESFSFIYNNSSKVPYPIKSMIVLQNYNLLTRINTISIEKLFQQQNLASFQQLPNQKEWIDRASQILANISGNKGYKIDCEKGYVVNIDNFFKMCLITQRMRLNIPIVIMGQAGIGKTALLRHVVNHLYKHQFAVYNINAGLPIQSLKKNEQGQKNNPCDSLQSMIKNIKMLYEKVTQENNGKKLWVFFDQFNTLKQLGFFKEIIVDKRYLGKDQQHIKNVVMMGACNPHKELQLNITQITQQHVLNKHQKLAFDVLPAPHSLIQSMWNYGALTQYQYQRYITKMISQIKYKDQLIPKTILKIHREIQKTCNNASMVSLRDIDRFRQLYRWFEDNLAKKLKIKPVHQILGQYNNIEERAFIMAIYFTYILRFTQQQRKKLQDLVQDSLKYKPRYIYYTKKTQQSDFCSRLNINWDSPIALNDSLKQNLYACFVCINTKLPLLIIGAPGSSKSLSLRLLAKNLKQKSEDLYLQQFKKIRQYPIQGSQNSVTDQIKNVFEKAYRDLGKQNGTNQLRPLKDIKAQNLKQLPVIVFDEIGLAQKSPDNPLKVLHPYLEVSRQQNLEDRLLSFIGISNSELDVSKMSRLLVLRRPPAQTQDLIFTSKGIVAGYPYGNQQVILYVAQLLTKSYVKFLSLWRAKKNNYPQFYGLRDLYGVVKKFMENLSQRQVDIVDNDRIVEAATDALFDNFNGWRQSFEQIKGIFYQHLNNNEPIPNINMKQIIDSSLQMLNKQSLRYPLIIAQDHESLSFIKWKIQQKYPQKCIYIEGSPFNEQKQYCLKLLGDICKYMQGQYVLILSNLSEGVKTGLYDFFNKSFLKRQSNNKKYLRMRTQQGSLNNRPFEYNEKFNCIYILLEKDLQNVEPPFISRFQKYRFSLQEYRKQERSQNIYNLILNFKKKIEDLCKKYNLDHFKFQDLFINVSEKSLKSLAVAAHQYAPEFANKQCLKRLIMNSGQYFFKIYKHIFQPNSQLAELKEIMEEAMDTKNNGRGDRNLVIRFTTDRQYTKKIVDKTIYAVQFKTFKKQGDFVDEIDKFFKSKGAKTLYVGLNVLDESSRLNYIQSQILRCQKSGFYNLDEMQQKKIRILCLFDKQKDEVRRTVNQKDTSITHFTHFKQEYHDGRLEQIKNISKYQLFDNLITIQSLLLYAHKLFDFNFQNSTNPNKALLLLNQTTHQIYNNKKSLFCQQAEQIALLLQPNLQLGDQIIQQMLENKQITQKHKNFREALTKYFADKKLLGTQAVFLKYLIDKQSFLSYGTGSLMQMFELESFKIQQGEIKQAYNHSKINNKGNYNAFVKEIMDSKKAFITNDYRTLKMQKKLPTFEKKYIAKISRPRLVPFSKSQSDIILNYAEKGISYYIKQIYVTEQKDKMQNAYKIYIEQLKKKTSFVNKGVNLYSKYINEDKSLKMLIFLDIFSDFCDQKGLPLKFIPDYFRIIYPFLTAESKDSKSKAQKDKNIQLQKMYTILIGFQEYWIQFFKILTTFLEQGFNLPLYELNEKEKIASKQSLNSFVLKIYRSVENMLLGANILKNFKNTQKYSSIFVNCLFQMQKLQQIADIPISDKLKSTRTALIFIDMFDPDRKQIYIQNFMKVKSQIQLNVSHYQGMYTFFQSLAEGACSQQQFLIDKFQANNLFFQWFKQQPNNKNCLKYFILKCQSQNFVHNSVATISKLLELYIPNYNSLMEIFDLLNSQSQNEIGRQLLQLSSHASNSQFRSNISILITNIFTQKIGANLQNTNILVEKYGLFEELANRMVNSQPSGIATLFGFGFTKVYLRQYVDKLLKNEMNVIMSQISNVLSKSNNLMLNFNMYCLKLMRTKLTIKEIKQNFIKIKKVSWISHLEKLFHQQQSRSILVPKDVNLSASLKEVMEMIIQKEGGSVQLFDRLFEQTQTVENRYAILNFFMRYYFSMSYNQKTYKDKVKQHLASNEQRYSQMIGAIQYQLILRYVTSRFDQNIQIKNPDQFKEEYFIYLNTFNWLIATKNTKSPFHSIFFNNSAFHHNFAQAIDDLFIPCGPENPYINTAYSVYELTRNNNIGVYICSSTCDYLYHHEDCGWPTETIDCLMCGQKIGCKPGQGHTINRQEVGARRLASTQLKDRVGAFYAWSLKSIPTYWQMQRNYIQAQINRMKTKLIVKVKDMNIQLKGFDMLNHGRVSTFTYYVFKHNIDSIFYCLLSLGVLSEEDCAKLFKGKNISQAKVYLWNENKGNLQYIKRALNIDNKVYGWFYGVHRFLYTKLQRFDRQFNDYTIKVKQQSEKMSKKLVNEVTQKIVNNNYDVLFRAMAKDMENGLLTKELMTIKDGNQNNRFTRDYLQILIEDFVKVNTTAQKFTLSENNAALQGKMQFPFDGLLTEDKIDENQYQYSRLLKIPDKQIKYHQIIVNYELIIRSKYPFLDYILKNSQSISSMQDFYNVISFSNQLAAQVQNTYQRAVAEMPLNQIIKLLKQKKQERLHEVLSNPQKAIDSWNRMADRLGVLQNECTKVGRMNKYTLQIPTKAFLIDNVTKQNAFGLILSSLFHNFAKMHNELTSLLNSRKNQLLQYRYLNLYNQSNKVHPQKMSEEDVFMINQRELQQKLFQCSISSINYGRNYIFNNFDSYQMHFVMKLLGKSQFISDIKKLKNVCYNGQAFAQTSEQSGTINQIRQYFYEVLTNEDKLKVRQMINKGQRQQDKEQLVKVFRGDLQKIMIAIRNLNGVIEAEDLGKFIQKAHIQELSYEIQDELGYLEVAKIVSLYQFFQEELKQSVLKKLPQRYKSKIPPQSQKQIIEIMKNLPERSQSDLTIHQFKTALYRFIARILQAGVLQNDKSLIEFLPYRQDFWDKHFEEQKLQHLIYNESFRQLKFAHAAHLFSICQGLTNSDERM